MNATPSLFVNSIVLEMLPMIDADVHFMRDFYQAPVAGEMMQRLLDEIAWRQETVTLWGKDYLQPRLSAWYGDAGRGYAYSGVILEPHPWTQTLLRIRDDIEHVCGHRFNSVLLNLYRNEHDSVGWHSDDEPELGKTPVIASLSLGQTRTFRLRHKSDKKQKPVSIALSDGSLLLMAGMTQRFWQHSVAKGRESMDPRINLTFRTILDR